MISILAIDPSSTVLGWCILGEDTLVAFGEIDVSKLPYELKFAKIIEELTKLIAIYSPDEIACERAIRFEGKRVAALEVSVACIKSLAKRLGISITFYSPAEWKSTSAGNGNADKSEVGRAMRLLYPQLAEASDHVTDAVGIGLCHQAFRKLAQLSE